jgi:hypothetical protein
MLIVTSKEVWRVWISTVVATAMIVENSNWLIEPGCRRPAARNLTCRHIDVFQ